MLTKIITLKRWKPQSGGLRVTRRGMRKYAVLPVRDITFFKEPPKGADGKEKRNESV